jgi:hypothetical protein
MRLAALALLLCCARAVYARADARAAEPRLSLSAPSQRRVEGASEQSLWLRGGYSDEGTTGGGVAPLGEAHAAFLQTFEHFLEIFAAALEKACTRDKGGLFGGRASKRAHLKPDRVAMQQAYNHLHDCYASGLVAARTPQQLVLCAMQVRAPRGHGWSERLAGRRAPPACL